MAKDFKCQMCGAEFDTREQLDEHNRTKHAGAGSPATKS